MVKLITTMLRKGNEVKWTAKHREPFEQIKKDLMEVPMLISPDYFKDFLIFYFASFDTVVVVLLQKNDAGLEKPISFFNRALRDAKIKYECRPLVMEVYKYQGRKGRM
jgi:hypothetical protein